MFRVAISIKTSPENPDWYFILYYSLQQWQDVDVSICITVVEEAGRIEISKKSRKN